jgi:hypothetical protein
MNHDKLVKILIRLEQDAEGYPPVEWESLWARELSDGVYEVDNIPFYAPLLSSEDCIRATLHDGHLIFDEVVSTGGHSTVRVIAYDEKIVPEVRSKLTEIGCTSELSHLPAFFAVDIPPNVDYAQVERLLVEYAERGLLDYQESSLQHDLPSNGSSPEEAGMTHN